MLDSNIAEGKWEQVKGSILKSWAKLSEDELNQTKGDIKQIGELIEKRYGESQSAIREKLDSLVAGVGNKNVSDQMRSGNTKMRSQEKNGEYKSDMKRDLRS